MSAKKAKRQPKAQPTTASERDEAIRTLLDAGQLDLVRKMHFCDSDRNMPIAGTPRPAPCPWCGSTDDISITFRDDKDYRDQPYQRVFAECGVCGGEAPPVFSNTEGQDESSYGLALEAARVWNRRGRS